MNSVKFGDLIPNTKFTYHGRRYVTIPPYDGCCPRNMATCWDLDANLPAFLTADMDVQPDIYSIEYINKIPHDHQQLPNFNFRCNQAFMHPINIDLFLYNIIDEYSQIETYITDHWQIYLTESLHIYDFIKYPWIDFEPQDFARLRYFGLIDKDPEPLFYYLADRFVKIRLDDLIKHEVRSYTYEVKY